MNMTQFQKNLNGLGFYVGKADGVKGPKTLAGIKAFQKAFGLVIDGIAGPKTIAKMLSVTKQIQDKLKKAGYYKGAIDGLWGDLSHNATKSYQKAKKLVVDGIAGVNTRAMMAISDYIKPVISSAYKWEDYKFFKQSEFKCECGKYCDGYPAIIDKDILDLITKVRLHYGVPVEITSGMRCQEYNDSLVGSIPHSKHISGKAVDFAVQGVNAWTVLEYIRKDARVAYAYTNNTYMSGAVHIDVK